jgi:hypothetical protein
MIHEAKIVESLTALILKGEPVDSSSDFYDISLKIADNIRSVIGCDLIVNVIEKPKVKIAYYGSKVEPKSDLTIICKSKRAYRFSIKTELDKSYIHTSNSYNDMMKLFTSLSFSKYLSPELRDEIDLVFSNCLKKVNVFEQWNKAKGDYSEYTDYHLNKIKDKLISRIGEIRFYQISEEIKNEYRKLQESGETPYQDFLHEAEPSIQKMMGNVIKNEEYAKHLIFEMLSGFEKFGKDSLASAEYVVSSDGVWHLTGPDCGLVRYKLDKFKKLSGKVGRLQNVPRVGLKMKIVLNESLSTIAKSFAIADMSMKL